MPHPWTPEASKGDPFTCECLRIGDYLVARPISLVMPTSWPTGGKLVDEETFDCEVGVFHEDGKLGEETGVRFATFAGRDVRACCGEGGCGFGDPVMCPGHFDVDLECED